MTPAALMFEKFGCVTSPPVEEKLSMVWKFMPPVLGIGTDVSISSGGGF
jgi:hypothetical protein